MGDYTGVVQEGRPINLGRNHWKPAIVISHDRTIRVAPLTWGGIIGNVGIFNELSIRKKSFVAPLTWGGIIGNKGGSLKIRLDE